MLISVLNDDLLCEVLSYSPSGCFFPNAQVCRSFYRCWLKLKNGDAQSVKRGENLNHDNSISFKTNPFQIGQLYMIDWNLTNPNTPQLCDEPSALRISLLKHFISEGWLTQSRSLRRRKLLSKLLIQAARRGDIIGMEFLLFHLEPKELSDRLLCYYKREKGRKDIPEPAQELCLEMAAAGRLHALHWFISTLDLTWAERNQSAAVVLEASQNDYHHIADYVLWATDAKINHSPMIRHASLAKLQSLLERNK